MRTIQEDEVGKLSQLQETLPNQPRVAVVIPCRNEEHTVSLVIQAFRTELPSADIWVCDNCSTDRTADRARVLGARVIYEPRPGKGHAVRRLFAAADADIYVLVDGDATYDAPSVHRLVEHLQVERLDMVVGIRAAAPDAASRAGAFPSGHAWGNKAFARAISLLFGYRLHDVFSGYRVFSRRFVKSFPALSSGFEIETELTVFALDLGLSVREVPVPYRPRPAGSSSKLRTYRDGTRIAWMVLYLFEQVRPGAFFGVVAGLSTLAGLAFGIPVVLEYFATGLVPRLPTAVLAASLIVVATVCGTCGIILDSVARGRKETRRLAYIATH